MEESLEGLCLRGFTVREAVEFCSSQEECNPELDEDVALARMERIRRTVEDRRTGVIPT